jgi:hypothetical protein
MRKKRVSITGYRIRQLQIWMVCLFILPVIGMQNPSQISTAREYQLKAVFLFNFTQFVEWPPDAFAEPDTPLVIGIVGDDPFGSYLDEIAAGEKINNHPLVIRRFQTTDDVTASHILFFNLKATVKLAEVLGSLKNKSTLTVGDSDRFIRTGGMIRLFTENNRIRIRIDPEATKRARLIISPKLLKLAEIYSPTNN